MIFLLLSEQREMMDEIVFSDIDEVFESEETRVCSILHSKKPERNQRDPIQKQKRQRQQRKDDRDTSST